MKKLILPFIFIFFIAFFIYQKNGPETQAPSNLKNFRNTELGIYFKYPEKLAVKRIEDSVNIHHEINYENNGGCDMMGEEEIFPTLTDLDINIRIIEKSLIQSMKEVSPYIPEENFVNDNVIASPGFIDEYSIGKFSGYSIYEGAEGCGQTAYYFPIKKDRTLLVTKASIQALSGVRSKEVELEILSIPGVISREEYESIFTEIMRTLEIN